jgi:hypothetical protein
MPQYSSKQYGWNDISVNILGRTVKGLVSIEYGIKAEKKYVYGKGSNPLSIQSGNKEYSGEIELLQSEFEGVLGAVKAVDKDFDLTDIAFDIVWSFAVNTKIQTRIIKGVEIEDYSNSMKQGDVSMPVKLKFKCLGVQEVA